MTKNSVTTMSFVVNGNCVYGMFKLKKELYLKLLYIDKLRAFLATENI